MLGASGDAAAELVQHLLLRVERQHPALRATAAAKRRAK